jgi:hypothetical protein
VSVGSYWCLSYRDHLNPVSVFDILKEHTAVSAAYNSRDRELECASICQEGTREDVLRKVSTWSRANTGHPVCWLEGPAGSGKSTIAHTIARQCDGENRLAFSFFFSRGKQDRSDTTKFVPTFAYQLARSFPAIQPSIRRALTDNPSTPHLRLRDQIETLIIRPALTIPKPVQPMVVVIDGLDESSDNDLLCELIRLLVASTNYIPFRFLFASRPEPHLRQTFDFSSTKLRTYFLSLRDFHAYRDIYNYLELCLSEIRDRNDHLMRDVARPWPSPRALEVLVDQSDGLFIYVSTLVKFVGDMTELPQERLEVAMTTHRGVDPLYRQVLSVAHKFKNFEQVIGTIVYLRCPLTVNGLGQLLQLQSSHIRLALNGCQSILGIPDTDQESVRLYHTSLRDFLTDYDRARAYFLDPQVYHVSIVIACLELIRMNNNDGGDHLLYACQHWCYHLLSALSCPAMISSINASPRIVILIKEMEQQWWLKIWMYGLGSLSGLRTACGDCESVVAKMMASILMQPMECLLMYIG